MHEAELDLLARVRDGDETALERLLLLHYDRLAARVARRLPASMRGAVSEEDIIQQTLIAVVQELPMFEPRGRFAFYRWLCTVAEFRLQDAIKAHKAAKRGGGRAAAERAPGLPVNSTERLIELLSGPRHTPSQSVARHEAIAAIQVGLASLQEDYRRALQLRYVQRMPVEQVAAIMNRTPHAIHNLCHRALHELRAVMGRSSQYMTRR